MFLSDCFILLFQNILGYFQYTILLWEFKTIDNFNKLHSTVLQRVVYMTLYFFYKKFTVKPYSILVVDNTLSSGNYSRFRKNLLEIIEKTITTIDDKIRSEKVQYESAKVSALLSDEKDKYDFLAGG